MRIYDSRYEEKTCYSPQYSKISKDLITDLRNMIIRNANKHTFKLRIYSYTNNPDRYVAIQRCTSHLTKQAYFKLLVYTKRKLTISSNQRSFFNVRTSNYFRTEFYTLPLTHTFDFFESHEDDERYEGLEIGITKKLLTIKLGFLPVTYFQGKGE